MSINWRFNNNRPVEPSPNTVAFIDLLYLRDVTFRVSDSAKSSALPYR
jgi:hypothetical protein